MEALELLNRYWPEGDWNVNAISREGSYEAPHKLIISWTQGPQKEPVLSKLNLLRVKAPGDEISKGQLLHTKHGWTRIHLDPAYKPEGYVYALLKAELGGAKMCPCGNSTRRELEIMLDAYLYQPGKDAELWAIAELVVGLQENSNRKAPAISKSYYRWSESICERGHLKNLRELAQRLGVSA